jgi:hypothetical protein
MKTRLHYILSLLVCLVLLSTLNAQFAAAFAKGTAFTYQGWLNEGANPANGNYDLRFTICDSTNSPRAIIAGPLTKRRLDALEKIILNQKSN